MSATDGGPRLLQGAVVLLVRDVPVAAAYYRDVLGFAFDRFWGDPPGFCMCWRDGHCVMLARAREPGDVRPIRTVAPAVWDAYFWVTDVEALFARFEVAGARIGHAPFEKPYGVREGTVRDLDGHELAFGQRLED